MASQQSLHLHFDTDDNDINSVNINSTDLNETWDYDDLGPVAMLLLK